MQVKRMWFRAVRSYIPLSGDHFSMFSSAVLYFPHHPFPGIQFRIVMPLRWSPPKDQKDCGIDCKSHVPQKSANGGWGEGAELPDTFADCGHGVAAARISKGFSKATVLEIEDRTVKALIAILRD